jgi:hypothetical protein
VWYTDDRGEQGVDTGLNHEMAYCGKLTEFREPVMTTMVDQSGEIKSQDGLLGWSSL